MKKFSQMIQEATENDSALTDFVGLLHDLIEQDVEAGCCESADDHPLNAVIAIADTLGDDAMAKIANGLVHFYGYDEVETEEGDADDLDEGIDSEEFYILSEGNVAAQLIAKARHEVEKSKEAHGKEGIQALIAHGYSAKGARELLKAAKKNLKKGRKKALKTKAKRAKIYAKLRDKIAKIHSKMVGK